MITSTSLHHPMLRIRLDLAMRAATWESRTNVVGISHASGIDVAHVRNGCRSFFKFFDSRDRDITQIVLHALRAVGGPLCAPLNTTCFLIRRRKAGVWKYW